VENLEVSISLVQVMLFSHFITITLCRKGNYKIKTVDEAQNDGQHNV
jgi:hypothetical protein